ncbi:MAG: tRNA epoxyqueuosine(34) reductase QueG [Prevotella sp.]|nr:tRNA epoxyqueuosine(34) reductase QueG [Prevotella sp.]
MNSAFSSSRLKAEAIRLGFFACGIAKAEPVDADTAMYYRQWMAAGGHADMQYLADHVDKRLDPTLLLPGARSIVVVAMSYAPACRLPDGEYQIAAYALGLDYHGVIKQRLRQLATLLTDTTDDLKLCVDTVPILERYWAAKAGIGFIGRNRQLIIPGGGSMFFLGEIVTTALSDHYDAPLSQHCGRCRRCIDHCPTGALASDFFNSERCLSYQTIENRGPLDPMAADKLGDCIYGCDRCQQVCPWNSNPLLSKEKAFQPSEALLAMRRSDWEQLTVDEYRRLFKGTAVKRAKYEGLMRNIRAAAEKPVDK